MKKLHFIPLIVFYSSLLTASAQTITTVAGNGTAGYSGNAGQATAAELNNPYNVKVDASGNIYIGDYANNRIRKVNTSGVISTIAGNGTPGYYGDGGQATAAELNDPYEIALDASGNIYVSDELNNCIREISTSGIITTVAGNSTQGNSGDGGQATSAELYWPCGVAVDASGNIYIADYGNNRVRKVNTSGVISAFAGNGTGAYSGDGGQATAAELYWPHDVIVDGTGNVYIGDMWNNRVREVNTSGVISTVAGNGTAAFFGDGGQATAAELNQPQGMALDEVGNLYIADYSNNRIRMVNTSGVISTIAGNGTGGYSGDGGPATACELAYCAGVSVDARGDVYIADRANQRIRKITSTEGINELSISNEFSVYPNPAKNNVYLQLKGVTGKVTVTLYNMTGQEIVKLQTTAEHIIALPLPNITPGTYIVSVITPDGKTMTQKVMVANTH